MAIYQCPYCTAEMPGPELTEQPARKGRGTERRPAGPVPEYRAAVDAVRNLTAAPDGRIALTDVREAISRYVPEPGSTIDGWQQRDGSTSYVGVHWPIDAAITMAREPGAVRAWANGTPYYGHDLRIVAGGLTVWFHAFCPERFSTSNPDRQAQILAEINRYREQ